MVNKKGWVRIMEAFIAVLLIVGFLVIFHTTDIIVDRGRDREIINIQRALLDELAGEDILREKVLEKNTAYIKENFLDERISSIAPDFSYNITICKPDEICGLKKMPADVEIYSSERIISTTMFQEELNPKKIRIFMWGEL